MMNQPDTSPLIQIVDENDVPIEQATIVQARLDKKWHRIVRVFLRDVDGNVLLQKRGPGNKILPGAWDASASGHVDPGEDYLTSAIREAEEEIGLQGFELEEVDYYKSEEEYGQFQLKRFNKTFSAVIPKDYDFRLEPDEVTEVRWFSVTELKELAQQEPDSMTDGLKRIIANL